MTLHDLFRMAGETLIKAHGVKISGVGLNIGNFRLIRIAAEIRSSVHMVIFLLIKNLFSLKSGFVSGHVKFIRLVNLITNSV